MCELTRFSAHEMARRVRAREISPIELVEAHLAQIEHVNPLLNAFVMVDGERALQSARSAEAAVLSGGELGPLHGVPVTIKSSIDVAGLRCEAGTRLRAGRVAASDAPLVARLKAAGAIVLGNTNVPEMLMAYETDNLLQGRTNNPWDLERTPGGSSGGESAAIASGCSAGGVGSDGGGSIRLPAHFTGICGMKPTPGRIPATGHFPPSAGPFTQIGAMGPMGRTVSDLQLLFEAMAGPDIGDPSAAPVPVLRLSEGEARRVRVGYFEDDGHTPVTPETRAAVRVAAAALKDAGFEVAPFRPDGLQRARQLWWMLFGPAIDWAMQPLLQGREHELSQLYAGFRRIVAEEPPLSLETLMSTLLERDQVRARFLAQMQNFPVLLCPVCSIPAFRHGKRTWSIDGQNVLYLRDPDVMSYLQWVNIIGSPAAVVPVGRSPEGLPIGVQLVGRAYEDEVILAVAKEVETRCGGGTKPSFC